MCRVNLADFIFAKEYRGRESYSEKACVAALEIANKYVLCPESILNAT